MKDRAAFELAARAGVAIPVEPVVYLDDEQIFLLYATFGGDVAKTAHAADTTREKVLALVAKHGWTERIEGLIELRKTDKAGEIERGISRATNFCQAHRLRFTLEKLIRTLTRKDPDQLIAQFTTERLNKAGEVVGQMLSFKPLADLTAALEKVHYMTYQALCDLPQDRAKRHEAPEVDISETDIHARISKAMSAMRVQQPRALLEEAQAEVARDIINHPPIQGIPLLPMQERMIAKAAAEAPTGPGLMES